VGNAVDASAIAQSAQAVRDLRAAFTVEAAAIIAVFGFWSGWHLFHWFARSQRVLLDFL
jgi:hypothetical protein